MCIIIINDNGFGINNINLDEIFDFSYMIKYLGIYNGKSFVICKLIVELRYGGKFIVFLEYRKGVCLVISFLFKLIKNGNCVFVDYRVVWIFIFL